MAPAHSEGEPRQPEEQRPETGTRQSRRTVAEQTPEPVAGQPKEKVARPRKRPAADKRPRAGRAQSGRLRQPPQPRGIPSQPRRSPPPAPERTEILGTAVQAVAELAEIGLSISARVVRRALSRLPRP